MRAGRHLPSLTALVLTLASYGCGGSTTATNLVGPDVSRCEMSVVGIPSTVPPSGTRVTGTVAATRECVWTASTTAAWITVSPLSGQGDGRLTVLVAENRSRSPRSGAIVVNDRRVTLTQPGAPAPEPPAPAPGPTPPGPSPSPAPSPSDPEPSPPSPLPPDDGGQVDADGRVSNLSGSCPAVSFVVVGRSVATDARTRFRGGKCEHLRDGTEVSVSGEMRSGRLLASEVRIRDR